MSSTVVNSNIPANSITNPNSNVYLDLNAPFNFFEFLKQTTANLSPIHFNQLYIDYLNDWNRIKNYKKEDSDNEDNYPVEYKNCDNEDSVSEYDTDTDDDYL